MTIILLTTILSSILAFFFYKKIHKYNLIIYLVALVLALVSSDSANILSLGYVPLGLFLTVMYSGLLSKGAFRKRLYTVRAEYAIIASIFGFVHGIAYLSYWLDDDYSFSIGASFIFGILAIIIMIPLFVTSFQLIRRKMGYRKWKSLHQAAYIFFNFVMIHLILLNNERFYFYIAIYLIYLIFKVPEYLKKFINQSK